MGKLNCEDFFQSGLNCSAGGRGQEPCPPIADTTFYCSTAQLQLTTFLLMLLLTTLLQDYCYIFCCILFSEDHTYSAPPVVSKAVADHARQRGGCLIKIHPPPTILSFEKWSLDPSGPLHQSNLILSECLYNFETNTLFIGLGFVFDIHSRRQGGRGTQRNRVETYIFLLFQFSPHFP